jgi:hypothetical protein
MRDESRDNKDATTDGNKKEKELPRSMQPQIPEPRHR